MSAGPNASRISKVVVTPVAFADPPLLNVVGVHQPWALRAIVELHTDTGLVGLGETYADETHLARLDAVAQALPGADPYDTHGLRRLVVDVLGKETGGAGASFGGMLDVSSAVDTVYSPFEVACLDLVAREAGRPVSDLLGGAVRDRVPFSGYMFYKWAGHPGQPDDEWGEALNPDQIVAQAKRLIDGWGFGSLKLKGGVFHPDEECAAIEALREAFPDLPLRLDPNGAWTPETSVKVAERLAGVVEYLEDPTPGIEGMAQVSARTDVPLATNMCVIAFEHLKPAIAADAVQIVLSDHHL
ncbi:MAG TPA: enolase C-terminal domain-like protein, partial [Nocardioides sp.]